MAGWAIFEPELKEIGKFHKSRLRARLAEPLVNFVRSGRLDWHDIAPNPPFDYAVVHLWSTGARAPNREHLAEIKRLNNLSDADLPIPDKATVGIRAKADTIIWIRNRWFAAPGEAIKDITPHQVRALDIVSKLAYAQVHRERVADWVGILEAIRASVPRAEVWTHADLTKLCEDWLPAHGGFEDAVIEGLIPHEH